MKHLAQYALMDGKYEKARRMYLGVIEIYQNYLNWGALSRVHLELSSIAKKKKDYKALLENIELAIKFSKQGDDKAAQADALSEMANYYFIIKNDQPKAIEIMVQKGLTASELKKLLVEAPKSKL